MHRMVSRHNDVGETGSHPEAMSRRAFLSRTAAAGAATLVSGHAVAQSRPEAPIPRGATAPARGGLLYPQQNQVRNLLDLSGLWQFQLDPKEEGEAQGWFTALPAPRPIAVPCSWNDLFDDARDYLGLAWYRREVYVPPAWRGQRVFLRVGSANYAAKVWVNGTRRGRAPRRPPAVRRRRHRPARVGPDERHRHLGREQAAAGARAARARAGRRRGGRGARAASRRRRTTSSPTRGCTARCCSTRSRPTAHIDDVTVVTTIEGKDGVVNVHGRGRRRLRGQGQGPARRHRGGPELPRRLRRSDAARARRRGSGARRTRTSIR